MKKILILVLVFVFSMSVAYCSSGDVDINEIYKLAAKLSGSSETPETKVVNFSDVPETHWAYKYISKLAGSGVINGYEDGTFKPSNNISRAEFYKLMTSTNPFFTFAINAEREKVQYSAWYEPYTFYAYKNGFMTDMFGYGDLTEKITRKEMVVSLGRFASKSDKFQNLELQQNNFPDITNVGISDEEMKYVDYSFTYGLVKGYEDNSFLPENNLTRAEAATIVYRFMYGGE